MDNDKKELEAYVAKMLAHRELVTVLEAGCGSMSRIEFHRNARLVGIDISQRQLDRNTDLQERILGDLETYPLPSNSYDMIICWDVLEHLPHPRKAVLNFFGAVRENGIIVLASPNVLTLRGFVTKFTPHWFHVWFYRTYYGVKDAGIGDTAPFKSFHRFSIAPRKLLALAHEHGLVVDFWKTYYFNKDEKFNVVLAAAWKLANQITRLITFGKIETDKHNAFMMVIKKPA
jgi:SAM-dependent methyltransferase